MTETMASSDTILDLRSVSKSYGEKLAVNDVSLQIPRGSIYGFLGPNGAGKTTTIRSIMGIILPDAGEILFEGRHMDAVARDRVGYLHEAAGLYRYTKTVDQLP